MTGNNNVYKTMWKNGYKDYNEKYICCFLTISNLKSAITYKCGRVGLSGTSVQAKKKQFCFRKSAGLIFFYHLPARISRMCMRTYIFCFKKRHKQTNKIPLANLFIQFYGFLLQTTKDRAQQQFFNKEKSCQSSFLRVNFI